MAILTYNEMYHMLDENTKKNPYIGVPQNDLRCPNCGRHTMYVSVNGRDEWCLHCEYSSFVPLTVSSDFDGNY